MSRDLTSKSIEESWELDELRFYFAEFELHSVMWFSSMTHPHEASRSFVQTMIPVIHNYPLVLSLRGEIVEKTYISGYNMIKDSSPPARRFNEFEVYSYPVMIEKTFYKPLTMSMAETDFVFYKIRTRLAVPILTKYNVLAPGTTGWSIVITTVDKKLPSELYLRIGAKRFGIWKVKLREVKPIPIRKSIQKENGVRVTSPFNVMDTKYTSRAPVAVILKHYAGDIAISGLFDKALEFRVENRIIYEPIPFFISL